MCVFDLHLELPQHIILTLQLILIVLLDFLKQRFLLLVSLRVFLQFIMNLFILINHIQMLLRNQPVLHQQCLVLLLYILKLLYAYHAVL